MTDMLKNINNEIDFTSLSMREITDHIVTIHHEYAKKTMPLIITQLNKVSTSYSKGHDELFSISEIFMELSVELTHHLHAEETIIFPRIQQLELKAIEPVSLHVNNCKYLTLPIIHTKNEDEYIINRMGEIKKLAASYKPSGYAREAFTLLCDTLQAFENDLLQHIHLENEILFPKVLALDKELRMKALN